MTAPEGRRLWVLSVLMALLVLFVYFWNLGSYGLIDPDEGRYSEIPRATQIGRASCRERV